MQIPLRVILGYHSIPQVVIGAILGALSASGWNMFGQHLILPILKSNPTCRQLLAAATLAALVVLHGNCLPQQINLAKNG